MVIKVDREGQKVLEQLCDIALKRGGVANLASINDILAKTELISSANAVEVEKKEARIVRKG